MFDSSSGSVPAPAVAPSPAVGPAPASPSGSVSAGASRSPDRADEVTNNVPAGNGVDTVAVSLCDLARGQSDSGVSEEAAHEAWLRARPAWIDPGWWDMPLSPQALELISLPAGPELISCLAEFGSGRCACDHADESPTGFAIRGVTPGLPCECQLVAIAAWEAVSNWQQASATSFLVDVMGQEPVKAPAEASEGVKRFWVPDPAREEVALVLRSSTGSVTNRLGNGRMVIDHSELFDVARRGGCAVWVSKRIITSLLGYPTADARAVSTEVARRIDARLRTGKAPWDSAQIQALAKRLIAKLAKEADDEARTNAHSRRSVAVTPVEHGMALLEAFISEADAERIIRRLTSDAKALIDPDRSMDQKRADLFTDLLIAYPDMCGALATSFAAEGRAEPRGANAEVSGAEGDCPRTGTDTQSGASEGSAATVDGLWPARVRGRTEIQVVIRLETLLGLDVDRGHVPGLGDISADVARELAADGKWRAWITSTTGSVVATSPRTYHPTESLARLIRAREPYCRMPGCRRPAIGCDLDHTVPWPRGSTSPTNLGPLCRRHHNLKTHHGWQLQNRLSETGGTSGVGGSRESSSGPTGAMPESAAPTAAPTVAEIDGWTWTTPTGKSHTTHSSRPLHPEDCPF